MSQSKELTQFYQEYKAWLDTGAPQDKPFRRDRGLCNNMDLYMNFDTNVYIELSDQFSKAGLDNVFPFDECDAYMLDDNCHLNPKRIQWVTDHVNG